MNLLIKLTRPEISLCKQAASMRWQLSRVAGVFNQRKDKRSDEEIDYLGIRAEAAVAKAYGLEHHPTMIGIDDGADLFDGDTTIDVKSTWHSEGRLLIKSKEAARADVFVLVTDTPQDDVMNILGWTTRQKFLDEAEETDFDNRGVCFTMKQDRLYQPAQLWLHLTKKKYGAAA